MPYPYSYTADRVIIYVPELAGIWKVPARIIPVCKSRWLYSVVYHRHLKRPGGYFFELCAGPGENNFWPGGNFHYRNRGRPVYCQAASDLLTNRRYRGFLPHATESKTMNQNCSDYNIPPLQKHLP